MSGIIMVLGTVICLLIPGQLMGCLPTQKRQSRPGKQPCVSSAPVLSSRRFRYISGALEGLGKGTPSLLISLCRYVVVIIPTAFLLSSFRSGWRLECVLDHGGDYCDHFHLCLPQGNSKAVINYAVRGKIYQLHQREKWEISLWRINKRLKLLRSAFSIVQKTPVSLLRKSGAGRTFCQKWCCRPIIRIGLFPLIFPIGAI